jgi:hypothetical protein
MAAEISFCPVCAGKLESGDEDQFVCEECESQFLIEILEEGDEEDDEEEADDDEEEEEEEEEEY